MYDEKALRKAYAGARAKNQNGGRAMWEQFMSTNKNAKRSSNGRGWQSVKKRTAPNNIKEYKSLLAKLDNERRSQPASKPAPRPAPRPQPKPQPRPQPKPKPKAQMAGSQNFQKRLDAAKAQKAKAAAAAKKQKAAQAQRAAMVKKHEASVAKRAAMVKKHKEAQAQRAAAVKRHKAAQSQKPVQYEKAPEYKPTKTTQETPQELDTRTNSYYDRQVERNKKQRLDDDSYSRDWTQEFTNRHINNAREIVQSRGDDQFNTAGKYIDRMNKSGGVDLQALDKQTRTAPLYDEAKSEITNLNIFGDRYKASRKNPAKWGTPGPYEAPKTPDLGKIGDTWYDRISDINL